MGYAAFFGGFLAVIIGIGIIYYIIKLKLQGFSRRVFGTANLLEALESADSIQDQSPRSLNGCDTILLPQILKDFPDFDVSLAKTYAKSFLKESYGGNESFTVYNVVICRYIRSAAQKTIVFQAAASYRENDRLRQKRYDMHYTYILTAKGETVAANCPNCGGALGYGVTVCPYCDSRVANVLGNTWKFTEITES